MNTGPGPGSETPQELEQAALGPRRSRTAPVQAKQERVASPRPVEGRKKAQSRSLPPWLAELRDWVRMLVIAVLIVLGMHYFVFSLSTVKGQSMQPTLFDKEWLMVNKFSYRVGSPDIGDVVILKDQGEAAKSNEYLVKRIVGSPGDRIEIRQGELYRNGELVLEPYTDALIEDPDFGPVTVGADHYFVMGDNRHAKASRDSRSFQAVPRSAILGRADFILWPITRWAHL